MRCCLLSALLAWHRLPTDWTAVFCSFDKSDWRAWYMRDRCMAMLMGLHPRLGRYSPLYRLDDNSLSMV